MGFLFMFIWLCVCRLTGSLTESKPYYQKSSPVFCSFFRLNPAPRQLPLPAQLLLSAWRIRMLSNCYSFVALRIHSFDLDSLEPLAMFLYPFRCSAMRLRQPTIVAILCLATELPSCLAVGSVCVFSVLSCSI